MELLIFTERSGPRFKYVMEVIFDNLIPSPYKIIHDRSLYLAASGPRLSFGTARICDDEVFVPSCGLLFENFIGHPAIRVFHHEGLPAFFRCPHVQGTDLPFDLPAMIFFLISRYEEYLPFTPDQHDRFSSGSSIAGQHGFLGQPLTDQWALRLAGLLKRRFPDWSHRPRKFEFLPTYDVDMAWAYRYRGLFRQAGGCMRSLLEGDLRGIGKRLKVIRGREQDPFFTFPFLDDLHRSYGLTPHYFFLLADPTSFDRNNSYRSSAMHQLIRHLGEKGETGIHPSYYSGSRPGLLKQEIDRLTKITGNPVRSSRQHFLRLRFPETYRQLLDAGISEDYSMGFADAVGFRAGTAVPFPWYDLSCEKATPLMVHPFQVMDVTLRNYLGLAPETALDHLRPIIEITRATGGVFCILWHNSSFSLIDGWKNWKPMFEKLIREVCESDQSL